MYEKMGSMLEAVSDQVCGVDIRRAENTRHAEHNERRINALMELENLPVGRLQELSTLPMESIQQLVALPLDRLQQLVATPLGVGESLTTAQPFALHQVQQGGALEGALGALSERVASGHVQLAEAQSAIRDVQRDREYDRGSIQGLTGMVDILTQSVARVATDPAHGETTMSGSEPTEVPADDRAVLMVRLEALEEQDGEALEGLQELAALPFEPLRQLSGLNVDRLQELLEPSLTSTTILSLTITLIPTLCPVGCRSCCCCSLPLRLIITLILILILTVI